MFTAGTFAVLCSVWSRKKNAAGDDVLFRISTTSQATSTPPPPLSFLYGSAPGNVTILFIGTALYIVK